MRILYAKFFMNAQYCYEMSEKFAQKGSVENIFEPIFAGTF